MRYTMNRMIRTIVHTIWRVLVFGLGLLSAWFLFFVVRRYADSQLPGIVVYLLLWCVSAYFVVPLLLRILRLVIKPNHIPLYATTPDGWPSDPVNLAIIARDKAELRRAMKKAGWYEADKLTLKTGLREVLAIMLDRSYPQAPVGTLLLFNRHQDIAFEIPTNRRNSPRTRHHVRFWKLTAPPIVGESHTVHASFWAQQLHKFRGPKRSIWIGAATEDIHPIAFRWRTGQLTHGVSEDDLQERDFLIASLVDNGLSKKVATTRRGETVSFRGQSFRTRYVTDGSLKVVELKSPLPNPLAAVKKSADGIATE